MSRESYIRARNCSGRAISEKSLDGPTTATGHGPPGLQERESEGADSYIIYLSLSPGSAIEFDDGKRG